MMSAAASLRNAFSSVVHRARHAVWPMCGLVGGILFSAPTILVMVYHADYLTIGNESTAYRFFFVQRLLSGEDGAIYLPQGYLTSLVHRLVFAAILGSAPTAAALREAIFGWGVLSATFWNVLLTVGLVSWLLWRSDTGERLAALLASLGPLLCTTTAGFYYALLPDYLHVNLVLAALTVMLFLAAVSTHRLDGVAGAFVLGTWIGLVSTNKISWLPFATIVLAPSVGRLLRRPARLILFGSATLLASLLSFLLVVLVVYGFSVAMIASVGRPWLQFVFDPGSQPGFWDQFLKLYLTQYNYLYLFLLCLALFFVVGVRLCRPRNACLPDLVILVMLIGAGVFAAWTVIKRPAGTTAFETSVMLYCLAAASIGWQYRVPIMMRATWAFVGVSVLLAALTFQADHNLAVIRDSQERSARLWGLHEDIIGRGRPAVIVLPDNAYAVQSVEEALLKGFSDFPSWNITKGQPAIDALTGGMTFRTEQGGEVPAQPYPAGITVAIFERRDLQSLMERYPNLGAAVHHTGTSCSSWTFSALNIVTVCSIP